jgi:hypothetical protein
VNREIDERNFESSILLQEVQPCETQRECLLSLWPRKRQREREESRYFYFRKEPMLQRGKTKEEEEEKRAFAVPFCYRGQKEREESDPFLFLGSS